jgi:hypothetical protein
MSEHVNNGMGDTYDYGGETSIPDVSSGPGIDLSWLPGLISTGEKIATAQFGQPQLAPNTYIRTARGAVMTNQAVGGAGITSFNASGGFSTTTLIIGAVVIGGLLLAFKK